MKNMIVIIPLALSLFGCGYEPTGAQLEEWRNKSEFYMKARQNACAARGLVLEEVSWTVSEQNGKSSRDVTKSNYICVDKSTGGLFKFEWPDGKRPVYKPETRP